jgi:hypothetical protein
MDLVRDTGLDVSDWKNFRGGKARAASNPKYCYEWAFVEPGTMVVLNLWYENMPAARGRNFQKINPRKRALAAAESSSAAVWRKRALERLIKQSKLHIASGFPFALLFVMAKRAALTIQKREPHKSNGDCSTPHRGPLPAMIGQPANAVWNVASCLYRQQSFRLIKSWKGSRGHRGSAS